METSTKEFWVVNGRTLAGWRIDRIADDNVGLEMLRRPIAIVPDKACADMIAAVPEMLEVIEMLLADGISITSRGPEGGEILDKAESARKKARGGQ